MRGRGRHDIAEGMGEDMDQAFIAVWALVSAARIAEAEVGTVRVVPEGVSSVMGNNRPCLLGSAGAKCPIIYGKDCQDL